MKPKLETAKNPRGHLAFAVLAVLILSTVAGSLFFTNKILDIFRDSIDIHEGSAGQVGNLTSLATRARNVIAIGHEIFNSDNVPAARARQVVALLEFNTQLSKTWDSIDQAQVPAGRAMISDLLNQVKYMMERVARDHETVFRLLEAGEPGLANQFMTATSSLQETVLELISGAANSIQGNMQMTLEEQIDEADLFRDYSYLIILVLAIFLALLTLYGRKIYIKMLLSGEAHGKAVEESGAAQADLAGYTGALNEHAIVAVTDTKGTIIHANDRFSQISKYSKAELIGSNHRILASGYHPKSFFREMYGTIAKGQTWHGEIKNRAKDGTSYWVNTTITPLKGPDGKINRYAAIRTDITDRKKAEEILRANEGILTATFDNFPGAISVIDADLALIAVNDTFFELLNLPRDLLTPNATLEDIIRYNAERGEYGDGEVNELVRERIELAKKFEAHSFERTRPDGVTIKVSGIPLPNGGFVTTYLDVTEERQNVEALRDAKNQYQRLMETTNVVPWQYDLARRQFDYVGPQTESLLGYSVEDWYGDGFWLTSMHPDDREEVLDFCNVANRKLEDYDVEYRMLNREGELIWVHSYVSVSSEDNKPVSLNGVLVDITERKKTEQERSRQARLLDLLSDVSVAANNVMDPDTIFYFCLRRICEFTGWSFGHVYSPAPDGTGLLKSTEFTYADDPEQLVGFVEATEKMKFKPGEGLPGRVFKKGSLDWIVNIAEDASLPRSQACRQSGLKGGIAVPVEIDKKIVSILEFFSRSEMAPSSDEIEMLNFVAHQVGRVIERNRSEQELTAHRDHLQEMVELATTELEKKAKDLVEALDKEKHLNELQRQFVSMTSHEFRTPLTIIDSAAQRMKRRVENGGLSSGDAIERIDNIRAAVQRMIRLMESTLSAARMDEGKIGITIGACDLEKIVRRVCESQNDVTTSHNIVLDLVDIPPTIKADAGSLEQVFTNLLSNAVKYSPDDPEIKVTAHARDGQVVVSISDNGLGIDAEDLERIGERFFRAKTSTGIAGTGIGLNLVNALVLQHGGSLNVESTIGEGSTFIVQLPIDGPGPEKTDLAGSTEEIVAA